MSARDVRHTAAATVTTSSTSAAVPEGDDVPWLSAEQQRYWRAFQGGTTRLQEALSHQLERDSGLLPGEYEVLVRLSEAPGRSLRMSELADELAHSRSRMTHTVRRMEASGLVERQRCPSDLRGVNCVMTAAGWKAIVAAAPGHVRMVREALVDVLTFEQLAAVGEAMAAVDEALRASGAAGGRD